MAKQQDSGFGGTAARDKRERKDWVTSFKVLNVACAGGIHGE